MKKSKLLELLGLEKIIESLQNLVEVRIAIIKSEVETKIAEKIANILPLLFLVGSLSLVILFGSLTLAFYLADVLDSFIYEFGLVALFYLILTIIHYGIQKNRDYRVRGLWQIAAPWPVRVLRDNQP